MVGNEEMTAEPHAPFAPRAQSTADVVVEASCGHSSRVSELCGLTTAHFYRPLSVQLPTLPKQLQLGTPIGWCHFCIFLTTASSQKYYQQMN